MRLPLSILGIGLLAAILFSCGSFADPAVEGETSSRTPSRYELTSIESLGPLKKDPGEILRVVVTTTILGDVVAEVGGDFIDLTVLFRGGADPHTYEPTPRDIQQIVDADLVIVNGFELEEGLGGVLEQTGEEVPVVSASEGIHPLYLTDPETQHAEALPFHTAEAGSLAVPQERVDPHIWFDPVRVRQWVLNTAEALRALDPTHRDEFNENAARYRKELEALDDWIREQVAQVPEDRRSLVTDHHALGYFAARYGFEIVGAVIPAYSTAASPSAQEFAALLEVIQQFDVEAVFVGMTANPQLAERISEDTGVELIPLYIGSLSSVDGPAPTYVAFMRFNTLAIVEALK